MKTKLMLPRQKSLIMPQITNPFEFEKNLSFLDKLQVAVMSVTVAPLRLVLAVLLIFMAWLIALVGISCRSEEQKLKPMSGWRLFLHKPFLALGRAVFFIIGFYKVRTKGKRAEVHVAPLLVVAPHSSLFDTIIFFLESPLVTGVSRSENGKIPIIGSLIEFAQPLLVKREDPNSRMNTIKEIKRRGESRGKWSQIIIFPEGTCTNRTCLISFKLGAFYSGLPVQPVCVKYPNKLDTVTWTSLGPPAHIQLWLTLCQFYTRCEVEYLPVFTPNEEHMTNARLFADSVRKEMAECLNLPITDHSFEDMRLMHAAQKLKMPSCVGLVEFEKLHTKLGIKYDEMRDLLNKFSKIKSDKSRKDQAASLTFNEFSEYLLIPKSEVLQRVFDLYDRDGSGTIDFREYVIGLSLVSAPVNNDDTFDLAFTLLDTDNKGYITQEELQSLLGNVFSITVLDSKKIFNEADTDKDGRITFEEFKIHAKKKPEYAKIFTTYRDFKIQEQQMSLKSNIFIDDQFSEFDQWATQVDESIKKLQ